MTRSQVALVAGAVLVIAAGIAISRMGKPGADSSTTVARGTTTGTGPGRAPGMVPAHEGATCDLAGLDPIERRRTEALPDSLAQWNYWRVPEYQDAQRFVDSPTSSYGPLACVVANPRLADFTPAQFASGALVAMLYLHEPASTGAYTDLKLSEPGFYCVWIRGSVERREVEAFVVRVTARRCDDLTDANRLEVRPRTWASVTNPADYPAVARFVGKTGWRPLIGVRCLAAWCVIGPRGALVEGPAHDIPGAGAVGHARHAVLGWFDQQHLAVRNTAHPPLHLKATTRGSIVPEDALDSYPLDKFRDPAPTQVARIYMDGRRTKYESAWGFTRVGPRNPNALSLQLMPDGTWKVFVNGTHRPNLRVTRADHSGFGLHTVGTARWKWSDRDEMIWVRCGEGCCSVEDTGATVSGGT
jgi:hypothetical protein